MVIARSRMSLAMNILEVMVVFDGRSERNVPQSLLCNDFHALGKPSVSPRKWSSM
jgi:hypothetical protein